jgi:hypothetical protein
MGSFPTIISTQIYHLADQLSLIRGHNPTLPGTEQFGGIKGRDHNLASGSYWPVVCCYTKALGTVFYNLTKPISQWRQIDRFAIKMWENS